MAKKGVVTGCAGFIGSHLCDCLISEGWEVTGIDDLSVGDMKNISHLKGNPNFRFVNADVTRPEQFERIAIEGVDCVFHHAGKKMVFSVKEPEADLLTNIYGTLNMLRWSSRNNAKRFIMASSIAVYGNPKNPPSKESSAIMPTNPYGVSKYACEEYCRLWFREYKLPVVIFRYASVYGPRQAMNVGVVNAFIKRISSGEEITVFGDGNNTRAFTYVADIVQANLLAANTRDDSVFGEVFNVSMEKSVSINELVQAISRKLGKKPMIRHDKERVGEIKHMIADISKISNALKFKPSVSIKEGISRTVDYNEKGKL